MSLTFVSIPADATLPGSVAVTLSALPGAEIVPDPATGLGLDRPLVCLMDSPARDIARRLATGQTAAAAVDGWIAMAEDVLALLRRHRRRVTLVNRADMARRPTAVLAALANRLGWGMAPVVDGAGEEPDPAGDPILGLVAAWLVGETPRLRALDEEIASMSLVPEGEAGAGTDLAEAALAARAGQMGDLARMRAEAGEMRTERELFRDQLRLTQVEMVRMARETEALRADLAAQAAAETGTQAERKLFRDQLRLSEAATAQMARETETLRADLAARTAALAKAGEEIAALRAEAQRPQAPAPAPVLAPSDDSARRLAAAEHAAYKAADEARIAMARNAALQAELDIRDRRLRQLELAQAATLAAAASADDRQRAAEPEIAALRARLDAATARLVGFEGEHASLLADLAEARRQAAAGQGRLEQAIRDRDAARAELAAAQEQINALFASTSWRVTAPLRAARTATRRKPGTPS